MPESPPDQTDLSPPIITLTTDFGAADGFPAAMKGVILGIERGATVVDATHDVPPGDIAHASFALAAFAPHFPAGTVHVAVVDPGVGTDRKPLVVAAPDGSLFVGPDNGVLTHVLSAGGPLEAATHERPFLESASSALPEGFEAHAIEHDPSSPPSHTFHGRDVFAPAAARLAAGTSPDGMGPRLEGVVALNLPGPRREGDELVGRVQYIDHFGDAATDVLGDTFDPGIRSVSVAGREIRGVSDSYQAAGSLGCVVASHGYLEVFVTGSSAAEKLGLTVGDEVRVRLAR